MLNSTDDLIYQRSSVVLFIKYADALIPVFIHPSLRASWREYQRNGMFWRLIRGRQAHQGFLFTVFSGTGPSVAVVDRERGMAVGGVCAVLVPPVSLGSRADGLFKELCQR